MFSDSPVRIIANLMLWIMWLMTFHNLLTRKFSLLVTWTVELLLYIPFYLTSCFLPNMTVTSVLLGPVSLLVVVLIMYSDKLWKIVAVFFSTQIIVIICEAATVLLFLNNGDADFEIKTLPVYHQVYSFSFLLLLNAVLLLLFNFFVGRHKKNYPISLSPAASIVLTVFPVSQFVILCGIAPYLNTFSPERMTYLGVASFLCIAIDYAVFRVFRGETWRARLETENRFFSQQINAQNDYYSALTEQFESISKMRHDMANHLFTINSLLDEGRTSEAAEYTAEIQSSNAFDSSLNVSGNPTVGAFLSHRIKELEDKGINVKTEISLPPGISISNSELISAFGNLIDNAEEACISTDEKAIDIKAFIKNNYLTIKIENSFNPNDNTRSRRIPRLDRGLGTHILTSLANAHCGNYSTEQYGNRFIATLTLYGDELC